jgi:dTDP-4-amino-4,6-dideoxygalactose transaminase
VSERVSQVSAPAVGEYERLALSAALASRYYGHGAQAAAFERELAGYLGGDRFVLCANTGTSALHLALAASGIGAGDEVLVPSLTFVASFQAIAMTGARPVACDVDADTGLLDLDDARRRLTSRTKAVMPVHYGGFAGDLDAVLAFAGDHGLRTVEDAAHAFGSRCGTRRIGSFGDVTCFSFDPIKNITAGQGGAVVTADRNIATRVEVLRKLGICAGADDEAFDVCGLGWRYELSDLMAAIGRAQLARFESEIKPARLALLARYRERLRDIGAVRFLDWDDGVVPHILPVRVPASRRGALREALAEAGIQTRVHYVPNHRLSAFADGASRPACERLYGELVTLPFHPGVTEDDVSRVASVFGRML